MITEPVLQFFCTNTENNKYVVGLLTDIKRLNIFLGKKTSLTCRPRRNRLNFGQDLLKQMCFLKESWLSMTTPSNLVLWQKGKLVLALLH